MVTANIEPANSAELAALVRDALRGYSGQDPDEYEPQKFRVEVGGLEFVVRATEIEFPCVQFEHLVMEVAPEDRTAILEFLNLLHGRTSTLGSHWWLGDRFVWQRDTLWAWTFNERICRDHLGLFVEVAAERTPEIRARFGGSWPTLGDSGSAENS